MNVKTTTERDDLFTIIHKGLRLGLFDVTVQAGRTDWADPAQVTELGERWDGLLTRWVVPAVAGRCRCRPSCGSVPRWTGLRLRRARFWLIPMT